MIKGVIKQLGGDHRRGHVLKRKTQGRSRVIILLLRSDVVLEGRHVSIDETLDHSVSEYPLPRSLSSWRYHRGGHWNHPLIYRDTNAHWRVQEAGVVTTRYRAALAAAAADQLTREEEGEQNAPPQPPPLEQAETKMALVDNDSGICSLHAHDEKEPSHAIAISSGMRTIAIKSGVLAVFSNFYGLSKECPYAFLEEFCRYCDIQPVPAGSTSGDYRFKVVPFVLKGDAGVWLSRLPEGSIRTWAEFRMIFLDCFFPASKTSALKREITEARQEYDEPLGQYWDRFQGLLQACPNHKMGERGRSTQPSTADSQWIARTISA
ncbi:hypothetical protein SASPL_156372 [Salvia splendens]|uniref:Retrotransposon gag domain-containing protein n=1 Tax=Salvia splendens TaxID=180675 RepID=A0A8X8VWZ9_SALSN|nr:hypothetical protein SASPL_156372 [Salvia splendens]